jgi:hypothetical protein
LSYFPYTQGHCHRGAAPPTAVLQAHHSGFPSPHWSARRLSARPKGLDGGSASGLTPRRPRRGRCRWGWRQHKAAVNAAAHVPVATGLLQLSWAVGSGWGWVACRCTGVAHAEVQGVLAGIGQAAGGLWGSLIGASLNCRDRRTHRWQPPQYKVCTGSRARVHLCQSQPLSAKEE